MNFEKSYLQSIATTIKNQLMINRFEVMAWGSEKFGYLERTIGEDVFPALSFHVRTPKYPNNTRVIISLDEGYDTYIVEAVRYNNCVEESLGIERDVYFDMLHKVINELIEDKESMSKIFF